MILEFLVLLATNKTAETGSEGRTREDQGYGMGSIR